jgi:cytochrome c
MVALVLALSAIALSGAAATDVNAKATVLSGDVELGEYLSAECVTCHRLSGDYDGIPPIVGWPVEHFFAVMLEYRHKKRPNPVMQTATSNLTDEEIGALAAYFAQIKPQ